MPSNPLHTLIGTLIRIGLLFALVMMFIAEQTEARPGPPPPGNAPLAASVAAQTGQ